jgi:hypothetical protein
VVVHAHHDQVVDPHLVSHEISPPECDYCSVNGGSGRWRGI